MNDIFDIEVPDVLQDYSGADASAWMGAGQSLADLGGLIGGLVGQRKSRKAQEDAIKKQQAENKAQREHEQKLAQLAADQANQNRAATLAALRANAGSGSNTGLIIGVTAGGIMLVIGIGVILYKKGII